MSACAPVLVVEDDADLAHGICELLEQAGYQTLTARHGGEALSLLRGGLRPCLIVLDLMMPAVTGQQFLAMRTPHETGIPVLVVTAFQDLSTDAAGVLDTLRKPFDLAMILEAAAKHC